MHHFYNAILFKAASLGARITPPKPQGGDTASRCWRSSSTTDYRFRVFKRTERAALMRKAETYGRETFHKGGPYRKAVLTGTDERVLRALLFKRYNCASGRCDPSYQTIAVDAGCSRATAARSLKRLSRAGMLSWLRRCKTVLENGQIRRVQRTNSYTFHEYTHWVGFVDGNPPLDPGSFEWGAVPVTDPLSDAEKAARRGNYEEAASVFRYDPTQDAFARTMARLYQSFADDASGVSKLDTNHSSASNLNETRRR